jgi:arginyl-tRNA synthetase
LKDEAWRCDVSITVTANEQSEYFKVVLAAMRKVLPGAAAKVVHVSHGMMRLSTGKMSSRTGDVITGESLLDELTHAAKERAAESRADDAAQLAQDVAVAAIKYQILRQTAGKDIIFDRERALSLEGDSGPYLQYAYARTCAIAAKAKEAGVSAAFDESRDAQDVARIAYRFYDVAMHAQMHREPHLVATYLIELAAAFNSWYAQEQILDGTSAAGHKVALVGLVGTTLKNGLWLLGIPAPEKM